MCSRAIVSIAVPQGDLGLPMETRRYPRPALVLVNVTHSTTYAPHDAQDVDDFLMLVIERSSNDEMQALAGYSHRGVFFR